MTLLGTLVPSVQQFRGRPFAGYDAEWLHVEGWPLTIEAAVVDLAVEVAEQALADGEHELVREACTAGILACPYEERLYRIAARAAQARGATGEARALLRQLRRVLDEELDGAEFQPPTRRLAEDLGRARRAG